MAQLTAYSMNDLLRIMQRLRDPDGGCPWDLEQDFQSILPSTLEECYELADAIEQGDFDQMEDELGDVLFQVVFHAQMASEQQLFDFQGVINRLAQKLIRRHPHVFADGEIEGRVTAASTVEDVKVSWESIKQSERNSKQRDGVLADIPVALPALPRAQKLQKRAANAGLDWPGPDPVVDKVREELVELMQAMQASDQAAVKDEMGDLLFSCVNLARHLGIDAEESLRHASAKFERRVTGVEAMAAEAGQGALQSLSAEQLDVLWRRAKDAGGGDSGGETGGL